MSSYTYIAIYRPEYVLLEREPNARKNKWRKWSVKWRSAKESRTLAIVVLLRFEGSVATRAYRHENNLLSFVTMCLLSAFGSTRLSRRQLSLTPLKKERN